MLLFKRSHLEKHWFKYLLIIIFNLDHFPCSVFTCESHLCLWEKGSSVEEVRRSKNEELGDFVFHLSPLIKSVASDKSYHPTGLRRMGKV